VGKEKARGEGKKMKECRGRKEKGIEKKREVVSRKGAIKNNKSAGNEKRGEEKPKKG